MRSVFVLIVERAYKKTGHIVHSVEHQSVHDRLHTLHLEYDELWYIEISISYEVLPGWNLKPKDREPQSHRLQMLKEKAPDWVPFYILPHSRTSNGGGTVFAQTD